MVIGIIGVILSVLFTWFVFCFLPEWVHDLEDKSKLKNGTKKLWGSKDILIFNIINFFRREGYEMRLDNCKEDEEHNFFILYDSMRINLKIPEIIIPTELEIKNKFNSIDIDILELTDEYKKYEKIYMIKNYYKMLSIYEYFRDAIVKYYLDIGEERKAKRWQNDTYTNFHEMFF